MAWQVRGAAHRTKEAVMSTITAPRGLAGVVVTDTELGDVRGREGFYHYRQYSAVELAHLRTFEDVWYLMVHGELPDAGCPTPSTRCCPPSPGPGPDRSPD
jgi:citrate synthase